jgi:hypothetical protein
MGPTMCTMLALVDENRMAENVHLANLRRNAPAINRTSIARLMKIESLFPTEGSLAIAWQLVLHTSAARNS